MRLEEQITKARYHNKLTQEEIAQMIGIARTTVAAWESGIRNPTLKHLKLLSKILHTPLIIDGNDYDCDFM